MKEYIKCRVCGSCISIDTDGIYTPCACGAIAVDGTPHYLRIIGSKNDWAHYIDGKEVKNNG